MELRRQISSCTDVGRVLFMLVHPVKGITTNVYDVPARGTASLSGTSVRTRDAGRSLLFHTYYRASFTKQMPRFRETLRICG